MIIGVFSSLIKELKGIEKAVLCIIVASSILCGNVTLFMFFVFLERNVLTKPNIADEIFPLFETNEEIPIIKLL